MRIRHLVVRSLDLFRPRRNLTVGLEVRFRLQNVQAVKATAPRLDPGVRSLGVFGLVPNCVRHSTTLDSFPCGVNVFARNWRLTVPFGQLRLTQSTIRLSRPRTAGPTSAVVSVLCRPRFVASFVENGHDRSRT